MQEDFVQLMSRLAPELVSEIALRALVLERVSVMGPVGRRQLAERLRLPEREIRGAAMALRDQGLIRLTSAGMVVTDTATEWLPAAQEFSRAMRGLADMQNQLMVLLGVEMVCIVAGDADQDELVLQDVGRLAAQKMRSVLQNGMTLAVTGGLSVRETARHMRSQTPQNIMVVPARGGMGRSVETQANTIAAEIAQRLGGHHRLIHLPDSMNDTARQEMLRLPEVAEVMALVQRADVILHGIGRADTTMKTAGIPSQTARQLMKQGAVGEAFGAYYDMKGRCLMESSSVGVDLARLSPSCRMVAVAAGSSKAEAIISVMRHQVHTLLVTDEGAASRMLELLS